MYVSSNRRAGSDSIDIYRIVHNSCNANNIRSRFSDMAH